MPFHRRIEIAHRLLSSPSRDLPAEVSVRLEVGLEFDGDADLIGRSVTELVITIRPFYEPGSSTVRIPIDFADDLAAALYAASNRATELHMTSDPDSDEDSDFEEVA
jgi:hypothetical protein